MSPCLQVLSVHAHHEAAARGPPETWTLSPSIDSHSLADLSLPGAVETRQKVITEVIPCITFANSSAMFSKSKPTVFILYSVKLGCMKAECH